MLAKLAQSAASLAGLRVAKHQAERYDAFALQKRLCPRPSVVYDVGANVGQTAVRCLATWPGVRVFCFEANPEAARQIRGAARVQVIEAAVSDAHGTIELHVGEELQEASIGKIKSATRRIACRRIRLDDFVAAEQLPPPSILKLDIEGHELAALRGADRLLREHRPLVFCEVSFAPRIPDGCLFGELAGFLADRGYLLAGLPKLGYDRRGILVWGDAVFVHANQRPSS